MKDTNSGPDSPYQHETRVVADAINSMMNDQDCHIVDHL